MSIVHKEVSIHLVTSFGVRLADGSNSNRHSGWMLYIKDYLIASAVSILTLRTNN